MKNNKTKTLVITSIMLALMMVLSILERMLPPLPGFPPGASLGIANIITMYCIFFLGAKRALGLAALKSLFVFLIRGPIAGLLSFCGGFLSLCIIALLVAVFRRKISYVAASVCGAISHNMGQMVVAAILMNTSVFFYMPFLIITGISMGAATGVTFVVLLPVFHNFFGVDIER